MAVILGAEDWDVVLDDQPVRQNRPTSVAKRSQNRQNSRKTAVNSENQCKSALVKRDQPVVLAGLDAVVDTFIL